MRIPYMTPTEITSLNEMDMAHFDKEFSEWLHASTKKTKEERFNLTPKEYKKMLLRVFEKRETKNGFRFFGIKQKSSA